MSAMGDDARNLAPAQRAQRVRGGIEMAAHRAADQTAHAGHEDDHGDLRAMRQRCLKKNVVPQNGPSGISAYFGTSPTRCHPVRA